MSEPTQVWSFWSIAIGGCIVGGIIGALAESYSAYLLENLRERRRVRKELVDLARNWEKEGRPDRFRHAKLKRADLRGAQLDGSDWSYADLRKASLQNAYLACANLRRANLRHANLQATHLESANLQEASLRHAKLDEETILPDGTRWTPETKLARFTDPDHPDFWQSSDGGWSASV